MVENASVSPGPALLRILVIDDEAPMRELLAYHLREAGHKVALAKDGEEGLAQALKLQPDLILLDLMMPGLDGLTVLKRLRRESAVPVIVLTALGETPDKVKGLDQGADDYLAKPFETQELLARVGAVARRATPKGRMVDDTLVVDTDQRRVLVDGKEVHLTHKELELLVFLMRHRGTAHSRQQLLRSIWPDDLDVTDRVVDVHVRHIREKIEENPSEPQRLQTVRGMGYRYKP